MAPGDRDDPHDLLYTSSFFLQVTTGCDHVPIPQALSAFTNMKELILADRNRDERYAETA
jgi:hypothetical protein